jgi:N-acetyl sugar amidotransferase
VSGGVDSSYLIYKAKEWGLRPLIVHFDNNWNSEIAVHNINKIIESTGFDLYTIVVNWEEFRDLQLSYLKAGVVDLEVPTDHAIFATWYKLADKYKVSTILDGNNIVTEAILPPSWIFNKADHVNLLAIHKRFGRVRLKTYPVFGFKAKNIQSFFGGVKSYRPLNLVDYNKQLAKQTIQKEFEWVDYGGKHYESVYTKFYQAYILPYRHKIDKRKPHLSNLILSGQMTREQAIFELKQPLYKGDEMEREKIYVLKKLGLTNLEFEKLMQLKPVPHEVYGKQKFLTEQYPLLKVLKPFARLLARKKYQE